MMGNNQGSGQMPQVCRPAMPNGQPKAAPVIQPYNGGFDKQPARQLILDEIKPCPLEELPAIWGCVFAKPCTLAAGQIDYPRTAPAELISIYGRTSVLAASSPNADGDFPLSRLSGDSVAGLTALSLRGLAATGSTGGAISSTSAAGGTAVVTGGVVAGALEYSRYMVMSVPGLGYQPKPESLPAFPDAVWARPKTAIQGGGKKRPRWKDKEGNIYEWDFQHGAIEKYNKRGKHLGEFRHITGEQTKLSDNNKGC